MSQITDLHTAAMEAAASADSERRIGRNAEAQTLFLQAFSAERNAALLVPVDMQPTRSVLLRSAASLAIECHRLQEAEQLIGLALSVPAPEEIRNELRDLYETINFHRHLELRGTELGPGEMQLALAGDAVGFGLISLDEYFPRIQVIDSLLVRTAERRRQMPFREKGRPAKAITEDLPLYLSVGRAASFVVTIRFGRRKKQQQLFYTETEVVAEFLECVRLFGNEDRKGLTDRIDEPAYYRNFVQQAKKIAPDGERIRTVGFTASDGENVTSVAMRAVPSRDWTIRETGTQKQVEIVGVLTEAAKKDRTNTIGLKDDTGRVRVVHVPKGLMTDIVRPLFDRRVRVIGTERGCSVSLRDIEPLDENEVANAHENHKSTAGIP